MTLIQIFRLILHNIKLIAITPIIVILLVFFIVKDEKLSYKTSATIYTGFASGKTINQSTGRVDFFAVQTRFDNLFANFKSRSNKEEIALQLLTHYLSKDSISEREMSIQTQDIFNEVFNNELKSKLNLSSNKTTLYRSLQENYKSSYDNPIYFIINSKYSPLGNLFGIEQLSTIQTYQEGNSDRVVVVYEATDPGICYNTIEIVLKVITENIKQIKSDESSNVVTYFITESEKARSRLELAEDELSQLMTKFNIINYYEQTRYIAERKENFEVSFQEEKLRYSAASAAEKEAYLRLDIGKELSLTKASIDSLRTALRNISSKITIANLNSQKNYKDTTNSSTPEYLDLVSRSELIKNSLSQKINELYNLEHHVSGVSTNDISQKWFEAIIKVEESAARLEQFKIFKNEFETTYTRFASLGSQIKQMERKINVLEEDYLDLLASLNDAKLLQQSIELSSNLKIVDPPFYPVNAEKSTKVLALAGSGLSSLLLILGLLISLEFFDATIKTCENAETLTKTELIGGIPYLDTNTLVNNRDLIRQLTNQIVSSLNHNRIKSGDRNKPFIVLFASCRKQEGKSLIMKLIARDLRINKYKTLTLSPPNNDNTILNDQSEDNIKYDIPINETAFRLSDLLNLETKDNYNYILIEIPEIIGNRLPVGLIQESNLSLLILKASRSWNNADKKALLSYQKIINHELKSIINGINVDFLESLLGEVPKKRSKLRLKLKRLLQFQFTNKGF